MAALEKTEVYIFVHLPGVAEPVLAGKMISAMDEERRKQALFRYADSYLARPDKKVLDPIDLPFRQDPTHVYETDPKDGQEAFSVMGDSIPDAWGRARMLKTAGKDKMTALEYILASGEDRSGFLAYGLDKRRPSIVAKWSAAHSSSELLDISDVALIIKEDQNISLKKEDAQKILLYGSSLGGARPKVTVRFENRVWLAKPPKEGDAYNFPRAEFFALTMARLCGLTTPDVKIVTINSKDVYLIERFDRKIRGESVERSGFLSMYAAVGYPKKVVRPGSYITMASKLDDASADPASDKRELFARIIFNALIGNDDDHLRNHAFYEVQGSWRLSPLFDVMPLPFKPVLGRRLNQGFGAEGSLCTATNMVSRCDAFGLSRQEALNIVKRMVSTFAAQWRRVFREAGPPDEDLEGFQATFAIAEASDVFDFLDPLAR